MVISLDTTVRKQAEMKLFNSHVIVDSSPDMLALLNKKFVYQAVNESYWQAFGKSRNELIGHTPTEVIGKDIFDSVIRPHAEKCLTGEEVRYEEWFDFPLTGRTYMEISYSPYFGSANKVLSLWGFRYMQSNNIRAL